MLPLTGLVDRITAVLREHNEWLRSGRCVCGRFLSDAHVAERVAEALQLDRLETARKAFVTLTEAWAELRMDTEHDQQLHDRLVEISRGAAKLVPSWSAVEDGNK